MPHIQAGVERLRAMTGEEYVLARKTIADDGGELLYDAASDVAPEWVRARDGQQAFRQVVEAVIKFVSYADDGYADRITLRPYDSADEYGLTKTEVETVLRVMARRAA